MSAAAKVIHPTLEQAARDGRLMVKSVSRGKMVHVLVLLYVFLTFDEFLPLKRQTMVNASGYDKRTIQRILSRLCVLGYLESGPTSGDLGRQVNTYRLRVPARRKGAPPGALAPPVRAA